MTSQPIRAEDRSTNQGRAVACGVLHLIYNVLGYFPALKSWQILASAEQTEQPLFFKGASYIFNVPCDKHRLSEFCEIITHFNYTH